MLYMKSQSGHNLTKAPCKWNPFYSSSEKIKKNYQNILNLLFYNRLLFLQSKAFLQSMENNQKCKMFTILIIIENKLKRLSIRSKKLDLKEALTKKYFTVQ